MSYDSSAWTGKQATAWHKTMRFLPIPAWILSKPCSLCVLPSTGIALTLSSGLSLGLRWRRVMSFVKHPGLHSNLTIRRWQGRGFFAHGPEVIEAWEKVV